MIDCHGATVSGLDVLTGDDAASDLGTRLIAPNRPGIGASTKVRHRALRHWAIDCCELAQALELERFGSLGLSMGANTPSLWRPFCPRALMPWSSAQALFPSITTRPCRTCTHGF